MEALDGAIGDATRGRLVAELERELADRDPVRFAVGKMRRRRDALEQARRRGLVVGAEQRLRDQSPALLVAARGERVEIARTHRPAVPRRSRSTRAPAARPDRSARATASARATLRASGQFLIVSASRVASSATSGSFESAAASAKPCRAALEIVVLQRELRGQELGHQVRFGRKPGCAHGRGYFAAVPGARSRTRPARSTAQAAAHGDGADGNRGMPPGIACNALSCLKLRLLDIARMRPQNSRDRGRIRAAPDVGGAPAVLARRD